MMADYSIFKRINPNGYVLIGLILVSIVWNTFNSENELRKVNNKAKRQRINDSIKIEELKYKIVDLRKLATANIIKTDSIKVQLLDNWTKTSKEERLISEQEKEKIFIHLRAEILLNMARIFVNYEDAFVKGLIGKDGFINAKLSNQYLNKYISLSTNETLISELMTCDEIIEDTNFRTQAILNNIGTKSSNIGNLIETKNEAFKHLYRILCRIWNCNSYKDYESTNFSKPFVIIPIEDIKNEYIIAWKPSNEELLQNTCSYFFKNKEGISK